MTSINWLVLLWESSTGSSQPQSTTQPNSQNSGCIDSWAAECRADWLHTMTRFIGDMVYGCHFPQLPLFLTLKKDTSIQLCFIVSFNAFHLNQFIYKLQIGTKNLYLISYNNLKIFFPLIIDNLNYCCQNVITINSASFTSTTRK